jgi:hypothetical protein
MCRPAQIQQVVFRRLCLVYLLLLETHSLLSCYVLLFSLLTAGKKLVFAYPLSDCVQESVHYLPGLTIKDYRIL